MRLRTVWGLDIGSSSLKLARVEDNGGRLSVQTYGPVALPTDGGDTASDSLAQGLEMLLASAGAKRQPITAALPRSTATIKFPRLPRTSPQQLNQMVRFEAQRYVPFAVEDVVLSFQELPGHGRTEVTPQGTVDQMELLLVAVRRDSVASFCDALSSTGQPPTHLTVSTLGLWNALHHSPLPVDSNEAVVVLDIGGKSSTLIAFHEGEMVFNRSAGVGSDGLTVALMQTGEDRATAETLKREIGIEPPASAMSDLGLQTEGGAVPVVAPGEEWAQAFVSELRRSLAALRGERRELRVERLYLTGGGAKTPGLHDYLEAATGLPTQALELPGIVSDPQFTEAVGVALGAMGRGVSTIDLVAEKFERERASRRHRLHMRLAGLAGVILLMGAVALGVASMQAQQQRSQQIASVQLLVDNADRKLKAAQKDYEAIQTRAAMLETALTPTHTWLDVLQDVSDRAPRTVWLSGVDLEKGKPMALRGTALNGQAVQSFWGNLARSPLYTRPNLSYSNAAKLEERQVFLFGITAEIVGNVPKPTKPVKKKASSRRTAGNTTDKDKAGDKTGD
ncbi:MAG: pilus assembly protein PilM [Armatimonadetes bacterium]|nr:pilus assembly protein PilM [Armatimonadota bacterium]